RVAERRIGTLRDPARSEHQRLDLLLGEHQRRQHEARAKHVTDAGLAINAGALGVERLDIAIERAQRHAKLLRQRRRADRKAMPPKELDQIKQSLRAGHGDGHPMCTSSSYHRPLPIVVSMKSRRRGGRLQLSLHDLDQRRPTGHMPSCDFPRGAQAITPAAFRTANDWSKAYTMNLHDDTRPHGHHGGATPVAGGAKDPVCGMTVDPQKTQHRAIHSGIDYFFCSSGCPKKFEADPAPYVP